MFDNEILWFAIYYTLIGVLLGIGMMQIYLHFNPFIRVISYYRADCHRPDVFFVEQGLREGKDYTTILAEWMRKENK